jgi:hypothetical protein
MTTTTEEILGPTPTMDDVVGEVQTPKAVPEKSLTNKATVSALLSDNPEEVVDTFSHLHQQLMEGNSEASDAIINKQNLVRKEEDKEILLDITVSPDASDEQREKAVLQLATGQQKPVNSRQMLKETYLAAPSEGESEYEERIRVSTAERIARMDQYEKDKQALLNTKLAELYTDEGRWGVFSDMFTMFFIPGAESKHAADVQKKLFGGIDHPGQLFLGESKVRITKHLESLPVEQKLDFIKKLIGVLEEENVVPFLSDDNQYSAYTYLVDVVERGHIPTHERFLENLATVADVFVFAKPAVRLMSTLVRSLVPATAPARMIAGVNPEKAKTMFNSILADESDDAAEALYGVNRTEAIADDLAPQVADDWPLEIRIPNIGGDDTYRNFVDPDVRRIAENSGLRPLFDSEIEEIRAQTVWDFENTVGVTAHDVHTRVGQDTDGNMLIQAVYGRKEGGFLTAEEALEQTKLSLRNYGVQDSEITILEKTERGYEPLSVRVEGKEGDYVAQVNYTYRDNPTDLPMYSDKAEVGYSIFTPILKPLAGGNPKIARWLLDPSSLIDPVIQGSAASAVDRSSSLESALLGLAQKWHKGFRKLPKDQSRMVDEYIKEANLKGLRLDVADLKARGMDDNAVEVVKDFRSFGDNIWYLENHDVVKTMKMRGYKMYDDAPRGTQLLAKELDNPHFIAPGRMYDPVADDIVDVTRDTIDAMYMGPGRVAELKDPIKVGKESVTHMLVPNTDLSYLRALRETDTLLEYRHGWYNVGYKRAKFVRQYIYDEVGDVRIPVMKDGKHVTKARAVSGNHKDAEEFLNRAAAEAGVSPEEWGTISFDKYSLNGNFEDYWSVQETAGRSSQRFRNERLTDANAPINATMGDKHIRSPVESVVHSARSIARRVPMREWLESSKKRWLDQYGDMVPEVQGRRVFPSRHTDIGGDFEVWKNAEAKTAWEYINYMENGYISSMDKWLKSVLQGWADTVGRKTPFQTLEQSLLFAADHANITHISKNIGFMSYLALHPLRQYVVQSHQATQLFAIAPTYFPKMIKDAHALVVADTMGNTKAGAKLMGVSETEMKQLVQAWRATGLAASIDKQNLVKGSLTSMMENAAFSGKAKRTAAFLPRVSREIGFDAGEWMNQATAYLTFRHRAQKNGVKNVDTAREASKIAAQSRNFTYSMNTAGDLPYNQESLAVVFQFLQVPHKALLNMTTNRQIHWTDKVKLGAFNLAAYGVPTAALTNEMWDIMPEDRTAREMLTYGLESAMVNTALTYATGEITHLDMNNMAPLELHGWVDVARAFYSGGLGEAYANSPAGKLFGGSGRITNAMKDVARVAGHWVDGEPAGKEFLQALDTLAQVSSGWSAFRKMQLAREYQKAYSLTSGSALDVTLSTPEQFATLLGIPTQGQMAQYHVMEQQYLANNGHIADVETWYKNQKRLLLQDGITPTDARFTAKVFSAGFQAWGPAEIKAREHLIGMVDKEINTSTNKLIMRSFGNAGILSSAEQKRNVRLLNLDPETEKAIIGVHDMLDEIVQKGEE